MSIYGEGLYEDRDGVRLAVTQQCRPEDLGRVASAYAALGLKAELAAFFHDLPERMTQSHLVEGLPEHGAQIVLLDALPDTGVRAQHAAPYVTGNKQ